jgi:predicted nucleic acid-binding protein
VNYYFDTSALCRYYHVEAGTPLVEQIINDPQNRSLISWLTVVETQSAFAHKVRTQEISATSFAQLSQRLKADIHARRLQVVRMLRRHYDRAEKLLLTHALGKRLRSLDALHLAVALDLQQRKVVDSLVTADKLLCEISQQEGLPVIEPQAIP